MRWTVVIVAALSSLCNILLGYDMGIMGVAQPLIQKSLHLTNWENGFQVAVLSLSSGVIGLAVGPIADRWGRKSVMIWAAVAFLAGALISAFANSFFVLVIGRLFIGVGVGLGSLGSPLLLAELTPPDVRGMFVGSTEFVNNFGIVVGFVVGYCLASCPASWNWRAMLGIGAVPPLLIFATIFFIPESPRWLMAQGREEDAKKVVESVSPCDEVVEIMNDVRQTEEDAEAAWIEILRPSRVLRRQALVGWGVAMIDEITGIDAMVYFAINIVEQAGFESQHEALILVIVLVSIKTAVICVPMALLDRAGRKPLLLTSVLAQIMTGAALALSLGLAGSRWLTVVILWSYAASFSLGSSSLVFVIPSEIFPMRYRAKCTGVAWMFNRFAAFITIFAFLPLANAITTAGVFGIFSVLGLLCLIFVFFCVRETSNLSLEELQLLYQDPKNPDMETQFGSA